MYEHKIPYHISYDWKKRADYVLSFHEEKVNALGSPTRSNRKTGWAIKDTAKELGYSVPVIVEDLRLGKALRESPSLLEGARTRSEALRMLDRHGKMNVEVCGFHGVLVKTIKIGDFDYYIIKLNNPIRDKIKMICAPMYLVTHYDKR
jgi:hypothetical protein